MAPIRPLENGTKYAKVLKHLVAIPYVLVPLAYGAYAVTSGAPIHLLAAGVLNVAYSIASAYVIFGKDDVDAALDKAQDLTGQDGDQNP